MAELGEADEAELQRLVAAEQQKAQFTAQVRGQGPEEREMRMKYESRAPGELSVCRRRGEASLLHAVPLAKETESWHSCRWWCSGAR